MIKLEEFIIEIDGNKYVPLEIAQHAQAEGVDTKSLDGALEIIKKSVRDINKSVSDSLKDD